MSKIYLLGAFLVAMVAVGLVYLESKGDLDTTYIQQTFTNLIQDKKIFPDGSSILLLTKDQPESEKVTPSQEALDKSLIENATSIDKAVAQIAQPDPDIVQYSKDDPRGVIVAGYILLVDKATGQNIKPYNSYRVFVQIECDDDKNLIDGYNYCNTDPIFGRVTTEHGGVDKDGNDLGGYFDYVWHPKNSDSSAFYDVNVLVTKDSPNLDGSYDDYNKTYKIQVL